MKIRPILLPLIFGVFLFTFSCKNSNVTEELQIDMGYDYFPVAVGKYWEYTVDSVLFDTTGMGVVIEETSVLAREEVIDTFRDNLDNLTFKLERFTRKTTAEPWKVQSVFYLVPGVTQLERVEDNLRFITMVFPLEDGEIWDGNQFIDPTTTIIVKGESIEVFKGWNYEVQSIDEAEEIGNIAYDSVVTITQAESENVIELRESTEKYARGVGLVFREMRILDTQCIVGCEGQPWEGKAQKGFILRQTLTAHN